MGLHYKFFECLRLIDASICRVAAEADTQFAIFNLSALKKQLLSIPVVQTIPTSRGSTREVG
jgi:hypothetical protein